MRNQYGLQWKRYALKDHPIPILDKFGKEHDTYKVNLLPTHVWDTIHEFTSLENQGKHNYACLGIQLSKQSDLRKLPHPPDSMWDHWEHIGKDHASLHVTWTEIDDEMWRNMSGSQDQTAHVYFGYDGGELVMMRLRFYDCCIHPDTPEYTHEMFVLKHDEKTYASLSDAYRNPFESDITGLPILGDIIHGSTDDIPNIPTPEEFIGVNYMMPNEDE